MSVVGFTLGLGQILVQGGQREVNLARAEAAVKELARRGSEVVLLPEALNLGWTHPSCGEEAEEIPGGATCGRLGLLAKDLGVFIVAGLVERAGGVTYNAAVLIDDCGEVILRHRKINELEIAHDCYARGLSVHAVDTRLGRLGVMICADGFAENLAISRALALMEVDAILSPCAWAVKPGFDQEKTPYGKVWLDSYGAVCRESKITIAGCSNVGAMEAGPWEGYRCIGNSIVMGPAGRPLLVGPFDETAALTVRVERKVNRARCDV